MHANMYNDAKDVQTPGTSKDSPLQINDLSATSLTRTSGINALVAGRDANFYYTENVNNYTWSSSLQQKLQEAIRFNVEDPIQTFTGRKQQILDIHKAIQTSRLSKSKVTGLSQTSVITGLGGIGKTETVRMYINQYRHHYKHIIWIDADNCSVAEAKFQQLALQLFGASSDNFPHLIQHVYETLCQHPNDVLVVFDNAESIDETDGIKTCLPKSLNSSCQRPAILVTSRSKNWPDNKVITLDVWTENESTEFILKRLELTSNVENLKIALELAKLFGHFPLAIQTAVAVIRGESKLCDSKYFISNLIKDFHHESRDALNTSFAPSKLIMMTLWAVTVNKILKQDHGESALVVLCTMAYLAPTRIPKKMLTYIFKEQGFDLSRALKLLTTYGLVTSYDKHHNVHRLVQDVTIDHLKHFNCKGNTIYPNLESIIDRLIEKIKEFVSSILVATTEYRDVADNIIYICNKISDNLTTEKHIQFVLYAVEEIKEIRMKEACKLLNRTLTQQEKFHASNHSLALQIKTSISDLLGRNGQNEEALVLYTEVLNEQQKTFGGCHPLTTLTKERLAAVLESQEKHEEALNMFRQVLNVKEKTFGESHPDIFSTRIHVAIALKSLGQYEEALTMFTQVLYEQTRAHGINHSLTINTRHYIANVLRNLGHYELALNAYIQVLQKKQVAFGVNHPAILTIKHHMAVVLYLQGQYKEALSMFTHILDERNKVLGVSHPETLDTKYAIATVLYSQGQYNEALNMFTQVLKEQEKVLGENHHTTLTTKHGLAILLQSDIGNKLSLNMLIQGSNEQEKALGTNHPKTLATKHNIVCTLKSRDQNDVELGMFKHLQDEKGKLLGDNHSYTLAAKTSIAETLQSQGQYDAALTMLTQSLNEQGKTFGVNHPITLMIKNKIGDVLFSQGHYNNALQVFTEVLVGREIALGVKHPDYLTTKLHIARIFKSQGHYETSLSMCTQLLEVNKKSLFVYDNGLSLTSNKYISEILEAQGEYEDALNMYMQVLEEQQKTLGANHHETLATQFAIARTLTLQEQNEDALNMYAQILTEQEKTLGADHRLTLETKRNLSSLRRQTQGWPSRLVSFIAELYHKSFFW